MPIDDVELVEQEEGPEQGLTEELQTALLAILEKIEQEDEFIRLNQLKDYKRNNLFWHGFHYVYWSEGEMDWRIPTHDAMSGSESREEFEFLYDYVINIYKAHGESIIAALSADLPKVRFGPQDAEDPNDLRAKKAADNAALLIMRQNRAQLLIIHALFYLVNEGFVASYTRPIQDSRFGTRQVPVVDVKKEKVDPDVRVCSQCGMEEEIVQEMNDSCPQCGSMEFETVESPEEEVPYVKDYKSEDKTGQVIDIYGPLNVRVPSYAKDQKHCGYLVLYEDDHPSAFKQEHPDFSGTIDASATMEYERLMRATSINQGYNYATNLTTRKSVWLRPSQYNILGDSYEPEKAQLRQMFPEGVRFRVIGNEVLDSKPESLDKFWTLTKAGPSKGVHADPTLKSLLSPQELKNSLTNLLVQTVEHGVPVVYADTEVFDFEGQQRQEVSPGFIYPVKARPGQNIKDAFHTQGGAVLSRESSILMQTMDQDGQFVVGSFPSIYGGPSASGSKTLGEYDKSRAFALQRLALMWYFINSWWGETIHKSVVSFIQNLTEEEKFSVPDGNKFKTIRVRPEDFSEGRFDYIEPEVSTDFPVSFAQKRAILMELATLNSPEINSVLFHPENARVIQSYIGLTELVIPNEIQRSKQQAEIVELVRNAPGQDEQGMPISSVAVEPDLDEHEIHMEVLRDFLCGDTGLEIQREDPGAYTNLVAHYMEHKNALMMQLPPAPMPVGPPQQEQEDQE